MKKYDLNNLISPGEMLIVSEWLEWAKTQTGMESTITFQVANARKPLAAVSRIVAKGNRVVFGPRESYIENIASGKRVPIEEQNGTYGIDVEYIGEIPLFSGQA